jgi:hypothetical protein
MVPDLKHASSSSGLHFCVNLSHETVPAPKPKISVLAPMKPANMCVVVYTTGNLKPGTILKRKEL